ncbi:MAG: cysteine hydrolase family protein [bacterium]
MEKCLIVVDFQNDFVNGSLGFSDALILEDLIYNRIKEARVNKETIIFTKDTHNKNYLNTYEGTKLPVEHCIIGTTGHDLYGKIKDEVSSDDFVFNKETFPSLDLAIHLKEHNYKEIEVCGLVSNICVLSNVVMARSALPNALITVDFNLTKSFDQDMNDKCFDILKGLLIEVKNYE